MLTKRFAKGIRVRDGCNVEIRRTGAVDLRTIVRNQLGLVIHHSELQSALSAGGVSATTSGEGVTADSRWQHGRRCPTGAREWVARLLSRQPASGTPPS